MKTKMAILGGVVLILGLVLFSAAFTVNEKDQALVLQFGRPIHVLQEPGLHWKYPFIQNVTYYEKRTLPLDPPEFEVLLTDKKRINVDAFARYQIVDPLKYFQRVRNEAIARDRLTDLINPALRRVLATASLADVLSPRRAELMEEIQQQVVKDALDLGMKIVDIRIGRTDLPPETSQAVFNRMRTERERQARELRAEGKEIAQKIRARADREYTVLLAEASRRSQILRGEGEASRNLILGEAYGQDPEFFAFYKSLSQYEQNLTGDGTTMVISPDSEFFRYFNNIEAGQDGSPAPRKKE